MNYTEHLVAFFWFVSAFRRLLPKNVTVYELIKNNELTERDFTRVYDLDRVQMNDGNQNIEVVFLLRTKTIMILERLSFTSI